MLQQINWFAKSFEIILDDFRTTPNDIISVFGNSTLNKRNFTNVFQIYFKKIISMNFTSRKNILNSGNLNIHNLGLFKRISRD